MTEDDGYTYGRDLSYALPPDCEVLHGGKYRKIVRRVADVNVRVGQAHRFVIICEDGHTISTTNLTPFKFRHRAELAEN